MSKKNKNMENLTEEQKIQMLAESLEGGENQEKKEEGNNQEKKNDKPQEKDQEKKEEGEEKPKPSPIAKVKTMKKKAKRTKRDDIYDDLKEFLEEKYGEVRMSKEGWAIQVEEGGEMKWHCIRVIAKKVQPEWK